MSNGVRTELSEIWEVLNESIKMQMVSRGVRAANELRNAELMTIRGQGGGRTYRVPGTKRRYRASAPGEVPAVRTGAFRLSWTPKSYVSMFGDADLTVLSEISSTQKTDGGGYLLGKILEEGTPGGQMAPRPHQEKIKDRAEPKVVRIYDEPYV